MSAEFFKKAGDMVTFRGRHGSDGKAPLIDGFEVIRDGEVVGFIWPGGSFSRSTPEGFVEGHKVLMSQEDLDAIDLKCAEVRKMPSEYGWIGGLVKMEAKLVLHHDDPPCNARLYSGYCPACRFHPETQSTCFYYYCPNCNLKLQNMKCPLCALTFEKPA